MVTLMSLVSLLKFQNKARSYGHGRESWEEMDGMLVKWERVGLKVVKTHCTYVWNYQVTNTINKIMFLMIYYICFS